MEIPENLRHLIGSNAWAINSKGSRSNGPKMVQNPHLPYLGFFRWYEAQIICESCGIDIYGAGLIATPNLQIAFNKYLGWFNFFFFSILPYKRLKINKSN